MTVTQAGSGVCQCCDTVDAGTSEGRHSSFRAEERSAGRMRLQARTRLARNDGEVFLQMLIGEDSSGAEVKLQKNGCNLATMIE